jgi:hypothetical protein
MAKLTKSALYLAGWTHNTKISGVYAYIRVIYYAALGVRYVMGEIQIILSPRLQCTTGRVQFLYERGHTSHLSKVKITVSIDTKFWKNVNVNQTKRITKFCSNRFHGSCSTCEWNVQSQFVGFLNFSDPEDSRVLRAVNMTGSVRGLARSNSSILHYIFRITQWVFVNNELPEQQRCTIWLADSHYGVERFAVYRALVVIRAVLCHTRWSTELPGIITHVDVTEENTGYDDVARAVSAYIHKQWNGLIHRQNEPTSPSPLTYVSIEYYVYMSWSLLYALIGSYRKQKPPWLHEGETPVPVPTKTARESAEFSSNGTVTNHWLENA